MARSLRALTDYLGVHPESLIRGRRADPAVSPPPTGGRAPQQDSQGSKP
jgi:paraquat-inducible protein B